MPEGPEVRYEAEASTRLIGPHDGVFWERFGGSIRAVPDSSPPSFPSPLLPEWPAQDSQRTVWQGRIDISYGLVSIGASNAIADLDDTSNIHRAPILIELGANRAFILAKAHRMNGWVDFSVTLLTSPPGPIGEIPEAASEEEATIYASTPALTLYPPFTAPESTIELPHEGWYRFRITCFVTGPSGGRGDANPDDPDTQVLQQIVIWPTDEYEVPTRRQVWGNGQTE